MKNSVLSPFLYLAVLILVVGMACSVSLNTGKPGEQATNPPTVSNTPVLPTSTNPPPLVVTSAGPGPAAATSTSPGPLIPPVSAPSTGLDYSLPPNYGELSLSAGFTPDPSETSMTSGGSVDASYLGGACTGFATSAPDFRLHWSGASARLRIMFIASPVQDTTLIINKPDGTWVCNDDVGGGDVNPMVELTSPAAGTYDIWVGSYSSGTFASGTLRITELDLTPSSSSSPSVPSGSGLDFSLTPNYGVQALSAGFTPDPFEIGITSGGTVDASYLGGGCNGFATSAPDFRLTWSGASGQMRIMFIAGGGKDTTLIINTPTGSWICNDDVASGNVNPMVQFSSPATGTYDIWVGSYTSGDFATGTLRITELTLTP